MLSDRRGRSDRVTLPRLYQGPRAAPITCRNVAQREYGFLQLTLAVFVACAGIVGNMRLLPMLSQWTANLGVARRVLFAWLAGNLFLGSQICWVLRPFIWEPHGPLRFISPEYLHGSFFETVFEAVRRLLF